ncbi:MAG: hypothetical protein H0U67_03385 [Gemmatimonadetes bacterium]|nr:hypothetical protein [Gemmatimonadota bacterium]
MRAAAAAPAEANFVDPARVAEVELHIEDSRLAFDALSHVAQLPAFPMAEAACSARQKLTFDREAEQFAAPAVPAADVGPLRRLLDRKRVRFRYRGIHRGRATQRDVAQCGLFFCGEWYPVRHERICGG